MKVLPIAPWALRWWDGNNKKAAGIPAAAADDEDLK